MTISYSTKGLKDLIERGIGLLKFALSYELIVTAVRLDSPRLFASRSLGSSFFQTNYTPEAAALPHTLDR